MNKQYLMSVSRKDAKEILAKFYNQAMRLPKPGREIINNPSIASGEACFSIVNTGDNVFDVYQYGQGE